jgi:tRNA-specific 2-thiouridylase
VRDRVLVAMSGGVDSSVAAARLVEQGFEVVGATMKLFCYGDDVPDRPCCSLDSINDARDVAHALGIPHYVLNLEDRFNLHVIRNIVAEYSRGRTPIPCVRCNSFTKFRDLLAHADALDCRYIATGHYAVARDGALYRGEDALKDQSYFLWGIDRAVVERMLTPVGSLTKAETRALARRLGLGTADKPESVEICFVPDGDYADVLQRHLPAGAPALSPGPLVTTTGEVIGQHDGYARYTIGQRKGLPGGFPSRASWSPSAPIAGRSSSAPPPTSTATGSGWRSSTGSPTRWSRGMGARSRSGIARGRYPPPCSRRGRTRWSWRWGGRRGPSAPARAACSTGRPAACSAAA